ncbi:hypothetical protein AABM17_1140 [Neisseria musculi]|uniref:Uncharacterized protein n=2 Tax=Neisseria musculi TaxID=1815583 RepID=A0A7H1MD22_9NEIS|nr:hypothetical protein H7A79_1140 [Neisseria musculi]
MAKKIEFVMTCPGLCDECDSRVLFAYSAPDDWDSMTDKEKNEWAVETFFGEFDWYWGEVES